MDQANHFQVKSHVCADGENEYFCNWLQHSSGLSGREEQIVRADRAKNIEVVAAVLSLRRFYIQKFAHAIPTSAALVAIAEFSPILEVGAGTGYWAHLLRQRGVDILCCDQTPPGATDESNRFHEGATCWTDVSSGDESMIDLHPERTLLLCWPPPHDEMPCRAVRRYCGQHFIYIGELPTEADGELYITGSGRRIRKEVTTSRAFFVELQENWELVRCLELPHWELCWDNLYVFRRLPLSRHTEHTITSILDVAENPGGSLE